MKKLSLLSTLMLVMMVAFLPQNLKSQVSVWDGTYAPWTNGTGTEADPFLIENAQQLAYLANRVNNGLDAAGGHVSNHDLHYKLMTDVNLNGSQNFQWTPIGYWISNTNYYSFGGHFDGNSHTVSGLYIDTNLNRVGFFGYADGAEIKNLSVSGDTVATTGQYAGGIIGVASRTQIKDCENSCHLSTYNNTSGSVYTGGITGCGESIIIINCNNAGNVSSNSFSSSSSSSFSGGIVGSNAAGSVINSYNTGEITTSCSCSTNSSRSNSYAGGIVGCNNNSNNSTMTITNCYNDGDISSYSSYSGPYCSSYSYSGGIVGYNSNNNSYSSSSFIITNSYNDGEISSSSSSSFSAGIVGCNNSNNYSTLTITNSYNVGNIISSNSSQSGGILGSGSGQIYNCYFRDLCGGNNTYGGSLMSSAVMQTQEFLDILNNGTCAYEMDAAPFVNQGYPVLTMLVLQANTLNATNVTQTHATLKGTLVVMNDNIVSFGFRYKQAGASTYTFVPCSTFSDTVTTTVTGLQTSTGYVYGIYMLTAGCDTTYGNEMAFTTLSVNATTDNATSITQTHASLNGSFTIGDANMSAQGFEYKKSADTTYQIVNVSGEGDITETITGLTPSTQYVYRAFCTADGCETVYGTTKYFTTQNVNVTTNPATDLTESSATLNGTMNMGDATITSKGFEYKTVDEENYTSITVTTDTNVFSIPLYGLPVNTRYQYRAFVNIAENTETYYGTTQTFEVSWLNADTIFIYDADMLQWVADRCNSGTTFAGKYIQLMNNIVLPLNQPNNMTSIGRYPSCPFSGTFDGNGLTISNLYIDQPNTEYQGFFGYTRDANLYEVGLVNITASGRNYTGGMVAYAQNTYMRDCYVNGGTLFALSYCGGLVGYQQQGTNSIISGCYNTCTVSGNHYVGGLVGFSNYATVRNSYVAASVAGQGNAIGAIIGGANEVLMYNCYFSSTITGQSSAIGENNFKDGEGLSDEEMRDPAFVVTLNQGLVTPVWKSDYATPINSGFPILIWQYSDAEACEAPENLTATVNGNSALLNWTGGDNANYFIVEYGMVGETPQQENTPNNQFTIHNAQEGTYFWRVKSVCSFGESNFVNGENIITGITNYDGSDLTLYPNPTTGIVNVQFTMNNGQLADGEIMVFDVYGRMLQVVGISDARISDARGATLQSAEIDLSQYATGIYLVKLVYGGKVVTTGKVVKQ